MMCDKCQERPATVMVTRIVNGQKTEAHLCQECARSQNDLGLFSEPGFTFHNILAGLFEPETILSGGAPPRTTARCKNCGLSLSDFRRLGQLGCSECYTQFEAQLEPIIRRVHGDARHTGKMPMRGRAAGVRRELEEARHLLQAAIDREAYEQAAELRDRIKVLEKQLRES